MYVCICSGTKSASIIQDISLSKKRVSFVFFIPLSNKRRETQQLSFNFSSASPDSPLDRNGGGTCAQLAATTRAREFSRCCRVLYSTGRARAPTRPYARQRARSWLGVASNVEAPLMMMMMKMTMTLRSLPHHAYVWVSAAHVTVSRYCIISTVKISYLGLLTVNHCVHFDCYLPP